MPNTTLNFNFCSTRVIFPRVIDGHGYLVEKSMLCFTWNRHIQLWPLQLINIKVHEVLNTQVYSETTKKLKIDQHEPPIKMVLGAPEGKAVPVTLFANLVMEYRINWEIYTSYAGAARMLLHINGKFTMKQT